MNFHKKRLPGNACWGWGLCPRWKVFPTFFQSYHLSGAPTSLNWEAALSTSQNIQSGPSAPQIIKVLVKEASSWFDVEWKAVELRFFCRILGWQRSHPPRKFNSLPLKIRQGPKRKGSSSSHNLSGAIVSDPFYIIFQIVNVVQFVLSFSICSWLFSLLPLFFYQQQKTHGNHLLLSLANIAGVIVLPTWGFSQNQRKKTCTNWYWNPCRRKKDILHSPKIP